MPGGGTSRVWRNLLIAAGLLYRIWIALRPLEWLDGVVIPDDTYLSLTIARNIAKGLGPLFGTAYTNGFQPLWVFLLTPVYVLIPNDPDLVIHLALVTLAVCETAMIALACLFVRRRGRSELAAALVAGCWAFNPYLVRVSLGGLETSLSALAACATLVWLDSVRSRNNESVAPLAGLGVLLGIAFLARVDNAFLIPPVALFLIPSPLSAPRAARRLACRWGVVGLATAATVLPWLVYSWRYTGEIYPVSGRAVRLISMASRHVTPEGLWAWRRTLLDDAVRIFVQSHEWLLGVLAVLMIGALLLGARTVLDLARSLESAAPGLLYGLILFLAYPLHILAFWFFHRYYFPLTIPFLFVVGLTAAYVLHSPGMRRPGPLLTAALIALTIVFHLSRHETWRLLFSKDETTQGYRRFGLWAASHFPPATRVGSAQTGALGYFAPALTVVNLDGVVNRRCFDSLVARRNIDYIVEERIEYVLGWKLNIDFIRYYSARPADDDLEFLGPVRGFQSWGQDWLLYRVRESGVKTDRPGVSAGPPK